MNATHFGPRAWAPLARALRDFQAGRTDATLRVRSDQGGVETMPVALFFRGREGLRPADRQALERVRGRVLDGGAGVGSIALLVQEAGLEVTAVEVIPEAVEIMRLRGVRDPRLGRLEDLPEVGAFDTILLLMNGTALAGTMESMPGFLVLLERLLAPGGQVLMDSTDLLEGWGPGGWLPRGAESPRVLLEDYPGELQYQLEYRRRRGAPFPQLFLDPATLRWVAESEGWVAEVVWQGAAGEYLARLTRP